MVFQEIKIFGRILYATDKEKVHMYLSQKKAKVDNSVSYESVPAASSTTNIAEVQEEDCGEPLDIERSVSVCVSHDMVLPCPVSYQIQSLLRIKYKCNIAFSTNNNL